MEKTNETMDDNVEKYSEFDNSNSNLEVTDRDTRSWMSDKIFKRKNIKNFGEILYSTYNPIEHWKKKPGGTWGVMDLPWEDQRWSILNKINTNYSAFSVILNMSNKVIKHKPSIKPFDLKNPEFGSEEWYEEYDRFMRFLKRNSKNIFLKLSDDGGSSIINKVVERISWSSSKGDKAELTTKKFLPQLNKNITNIKIPDGYGDLNDMAKGIDIYFDYSGNTFTIQVKKVSNVLKLYDGFKTIGASISKPYSTDYYSLLDNNIIYFFRNKDISLVDGELILPMSSFVKKFKYK